MRHRREVAIALALAIVTMGTPVAGATAEAVVKIGGSGSPTGSILSVVKAFEKVNPGVKVQLFPQLGSSGGIRALMEGAIDVALASRGLRDSERRPGSTSIFYARTPFVFATQRRTRASSVRLEEVVQIYEGTRKTWPDGVSIRLVLRPDVDTDTELLRGMSPAMERAVKLALRRPGMVTAISDLDSITAIESLPGSFGTTTLALIIAEGRSVKSLAVNGVVPTLHAVADGSYPYWKTFHVILGSAPPEPAKRFVAFLRSATGTRLLTQSGHLVVDQQP